jgi:NAD-dependent SIR2 family protein deacetylase
MAYASGKFAIALCDRCGQRYKLNRLIKEWTGFKVCPECYEPKHPQLEPKRSINEPQALQQPRPENILGVTVYVGFTADTSFASIGMMPMPYAKPLVAAAILGTVKTSIT